MESDSLYGERFSIRDSARGLKKYGSTSQNHRNSTNDKLIRHDVTKEDTLQGIALKYGCTTEQIRRTNRLYASDSLFSKLFLMIPVTKGSPFYPAENNTSSSSTDRPQSMPVYETTQQRVNMSMDSAWDPLQGPSSSFSMEFPSTSSSIASTSTAAAAQPPPPPVVPRPEELSPEEEHKKDLDELLGKIDSTIASSRRFVAKSQDSRDYMDQSYDYPDGGNDQQQQHMDYYDNAYQNATSSTSSSSGRNSIGGHMRNSSGGSFHASSTTTDDTSGLITNSRQVKSSLQRLERTQDELFEL